MVRRSWWKGKESKRLTKVFRHGWNKISHDELVPFDALVNFLDSCNYHDIGCTQNDWERMIRDNMEGM